MTVTDLQLTDTAWIDDHDWIEELTLAMQRDGRAAALVVDDPYTLRPRTLLGDDVEVTVVYSPDRRVADRVCQVVMPLQDAWRLEIGGGYVEEIRAPDPPPLTFMALARITDPSSLDMLGHVFAYDRRGVGGIALSEVPKPNTAKTVGQATRQWHSRSGVPAVRNRVMYGIRRLNEQHTDHGFDTRYQLVAGIMAAEILAYFGELPMGSGFTWKAWDRHWSPLVTFEPAPTVPKVQRCPDRIADALCLEADGAKRPNSRGALDWRQRFEEEPERRADGKPRFSYIHGPESVVILPTHGQVVSDFNLYWSGWDPTGDLAAAMADGTLLPEREAALGLDAGVIERRYMRRRVAELVARGLTPIQAEYQTLREQDYSLQEIADLCQRDKSTVSRVLKTTKKNLWKQYNFRP